MRPILFGGTWDETNPSPSIPIYLVHLTGQRIIVRRNCARAVEVAQGVKNETSLPFGGVDGCVGMAVRPQRVKWSRYV